MNSGLRRWLARAARPWYFRSTGRRPAHGYIDRLQSDPHFRDHVTFFEYFHGDNGAGLGAAHQTGWTALVAKLLQQSPQWRAPGEMRPRTPSQFP